jgi:hypothetical protein
VVILKEASTCIPIGGNQLALQYLQCQSERQSRKVVCHDVRKEYRGKLAGCNGRGRGKKAKEIRAPQEPELRAEYLTRDLMPGHRWSIGLLGLSPVQSSARKRRDRKLR